ncbi:MAG TPA: Crp/Fnr family transcriptional regulator [Noviherbaspirillum sp.]|jgi:CRP-like cAMP-binding protein|uniref:Crp/Fnr family transcriptional regulator n=1 Tax=Noviherbaspirillum sp. TaxID=1926288 RepID=UPI002DDCAF23|nr:Crp/Fnr family transcriptional regulator [Noviherbaspirillum sp.]HEV2611903.1 Crp/Fnr family transcriptional regulator [Noviherbaspirillum sp.]
MPPPNWDIALAQLTPEQRGDVLSRMRSIACEPRQSLFRQGEPSDSLYIIRHGRVRLYAGTEHGDEFTLGIMDSGRILGLAAAVLGKPRIVCAESIDHVEASILTTQDLYRCMDAIPQFARNIMTILATLAAETLDGIVPVALDSAVVRLATILTTLGKPDTNDPSGLRLNVSGLTQEDFGKMVGATRTWVTITLGTFERSGLIVKRKGSITVLDRNRLARYIDAQRNHRPFV